MPLLRQISPPGSEWPFSEQIFLHAGFAHIAPSHRPYPTDGIICSVFVHPSGHFFLFKDNQHFHQIQLLINGREIATVAKWRPHTPMQIRFCNRTYVFLIESDGMMHRRPQTGRCAYCGDLWDTDLQSVVVYEEEELHESCARIIRANRSAGRPPGG